MEYRMPELTLIGTASGVVLGVSAPEVAEAGIFDGLASLEAEW